MDALRDLARTRDPALLRPLVLDLIEALERAFGGNTSEALAIVRSWEACLKPGALESIAEAGREPDGS